MPIYYCYGTHSVNVGYDAYRGPEGGDRGGWSNHPMSASSSTLLNSFPNTDTIKIFHEPPPVERYGKSSDYDTFVERTVTPVFRILVNLTDQDLVLVNLTDQDLVTVATHTGLIQRSSIQRIISATFVNDTCDFNFPKKKYYYDNYFSNVNFNSQNTASDWLIETAIVLSTRSATRGLTHPHAQMATSLTATLRARNRSNPGDQTNPQFVFDACMDEMAKLLFDATNYDSDYFAMLAVMLEFFQTTHGSHLIGSTSRRKLELYQLKISVHQTLSTYHGPLKFDHLGYNNDAVYAIKMDVMACNDAQSIKNALQPPPAPLPLWPSFFKRDPKTDQQLLAVLQESNCIVQANLNRKQSPSHSPKQKR